MALECYHYRYNNPKYNDTSCSGSFEECRQLQVCPTSDNSSSHEGYHCFAAAQVNDSKLDNGTITQTVKVISAGCWPPPKDEKATPCGKVCLGYQQKGTRYYCCCTENTCNHALKPQPIQAQTTTTLLPPPHPPSPETVFEPLTVMSLVIVFFIVILLAYNYFKKKRPFRFKRSDSISSTHHANHTTRHNLNHHQLEANHYSKVDNLNTTELNELRDNNDVAVMMPFRNSFEDNNHDGRPKLTGNGSNNNNNINGASQANSLTNNKTTHLHRDAASGQQQQQNIQAQNKIIDLNDIRLLEVVGSGRFGRVHRATLRLKNLLGTSKQQTQQRNRNLQDDANVIEVLDDGSVNDTQEQRQQEDSQECDHQDKEVAVKVIPTKERQSWQNELEIYSSTRTKHPNILDFYGWCAHPETNCHWLCIEYASRGSLHHYLKDNTVNWGQFLSIALGIVRGLSHLHDANVVHRDFKSKNVLLRNDLSPCITDFGVAAIMDIDIGSQQKKFLQVGTPRYMSPEILECSIVFGVKNFMKIDIYAAALVIWELLTRCYPLPIARTTTTLMSNTSYNRDYMLDESMMCDRGDGDDGKLMIVAKTTKATGVDEYDSAMPRASTPASASHFNMSNNENHDNNNHDMERHLLLESTTPPPPLEWQDGPMAYKLPYEDYVGSDPDIDTMRNIVCKERLRPLLRPEWEMHPIEPVYRSLKESWEYDEDARVSATCFVERIERLYLDHQQHEAELVRQAQPHRHQQVLNPNGGSATTDTAGDSDAN